MYNENIKKEFISELEDLYTNNANKNIDDSKDSLAEIVEKTNKDIVKIKNDIIRIFKKTEPLENLYQKDLYEMDYETLMLVLQDCLLGTYTYVFMQYLYLQKYILWAINKNLSPFLENNISQLRPNTIKNSKNVRSLYVKDDDMLLELMDESFPYYQYESIELRYKCMLLLLFNGFDKEKLYDLESSMIHKEYMSSNTYKEYIKFHDEVIPISKQCYDIIMKVSDLDYYTCERARNGQMTTAIFKRMPPKLFGECGSNKSILTRLRGFLSEKITKDYPMLTMHSVIKSGIFYRAYQKEINNEPYMDEMKSKFTSIAVYTMNKDYQAYKAEFYV